MISVHEFTDVADNGFLLVLMIERNIKFELEVSENDDRYFHIQGHRSSNSICGPLGASVKNHFIVPLWRASWKKSQGLKVSHRLPSVHNLGWFPNSTANEQPSNI